MNFGRVPFAIFTGVHGRPWIPQWCMKLSYHFTAVWQAVLYTSQNTIQKHRRLLMTGGKQLVQFITEFIRCCVKCVEELWGSLLGGYVSGW